MRTRTDDKPKDDKPKEPLADRVKKLNDWSSKKRPR